MFTRQNRTQSIVRHCLKAGIVSLLFLLPQLTSGRPNVIIILTDDQGMGDFSLYGNPVVQTPHLDRLAQEGVSFNQFHVTSMCSPTRAALLTGLDPLRNGTLSTCQGLHSLREENPTIAEAFSESGYATAMFGKWHLGRNWPRRPRDRGFQKTVIQFGYGPTGISSRWNNDYIDTWIVDDGEERQMDGFCTDAYFNEAMEWIDSQKDTGKPFFTYISTNAPHFPFWAPAEWTAKFADSKNPEFFAMVANIDDNVGRLETFLEDRGLKEDTILVFLTDNGPVGGKSTWNTGMTGGKATPWEGGHRVPLFIRYPSAGIKGGKVVDGLANVTDLFPTLVDLCGLAPRAEGSIDGISLKEAMLGEAHIPERFKVMHIQQQDMTPKNAAVMQGDWRLLWSDALAAPSEKIGSTHQAEVILDSSFWLEARADGQVSVREGTSARHGPDGGDWLVEALQCGSYDITVRRWPVESGLALDEGAPPFQSQCSGKPLIAGVAYPITQASLEIDGILHTQSVRDDPTAITFEIQLSKGNHRLRGTFRDKDGQALCGTFYAYITKR